MQTKCAHCGHAEPCAAENCWHPIRQAPTRADILDTAKEYVTKDRAATHGDAEDNFSLIAGHWTWWLGDRLLEPLTAYDVAQMMVGFKQARARGNPSNIENAIDAVGYSCIAGEIAGAKT